MTVRQQASRFTAIAMGYMKTAVLASQNQLQILGAIIGADAIDVVDLLIRLQRSAEHRFHDETVLKNLTAFWSGNAHIASCLTNNAPGAVVCSVPPHHADRAALNRAKAPNRPAIWTEDFTGDQGELLAAVFTDEIHGTSEGFMQARPRTVLLQATKSIFARHKLGVALRANDRRRVRISMHRDLPFRCRAGAVSAAPGFFMPFRNYIAYVPES
jgi:hypothetical protein